MSQLVHLLKQRSCAGSTDINEKTNLGATKYFSKQPKDILL